MIALWAVLLSPLFQPLCVPCHGPEGRGDGPAAALYAPPPADLGHPETFKLGSSAAQLAQTLRHGLPGHGMPAFGALSDTQIEGLVTHLSTLRTDAPRPAQAPDAYWPEGWVPAQTLNGPPALTRLEHDACARCHPAIAAEWRASVHARAMGPGVVGQYHGRPALRGACDRCHAPLTEQRGAQALAAEGVGCAACHLRDGRKQAGPRPLRPRKAAIGAQAVRDPRLGRADFCMPCHTLPRHTAVNGRPLLDTWREWAASPYLPAGIQCQHCHLPGGDHQMKGVHDPETVRQAVRLVVEPTTREGGTLRTTIRLTNVGAGHHFPTTATPRAVLRARLLGPEGPLAETETSWAIGRTVSFRAGQWHEQGDTRIPAGATHTWCHEARDPRAVAVEVSLDMFPDWYYATVYRAALARGGDARALADYRAALEAAEASPFLITFERRALDAAPRPGPDAGPASTEPAPPAADR